MSIARRVLEFYRERGGENAWTQGELATNLEGYLADPDEADAVCWCLQGAAIACGAEDTDLAVELRFSSVNEMVVWNDQPGRLWTDIESRLESAA